jgi:hypothetical protein
MTFATHLLSPELAESLRRASLACAENQKKETGIIDFFCGLYLQDRNEISLHFSGDFGAAVGHNFPIHRFGHEGLVPLSVRLRMAKLESRFTIANGTQW